MRRSAGFTLVEMIVAIVITGILVGMVSIFIAKPVQGYIESAARAELTDQADLVLRRISREARLALPNSIRTSVNGGNVFLEFIPTAGGGSYRDVLDGSPGGVVLNFVDSSSCGATATLCQFDVIGLMPADPAIEAGDFIVVLNYGEINGTSMAPNNAYVTGNSCTGCNRGRVSAAPAGNLVTLGGVSVTDLNGVVVADANVFSTPGVGRSDSNSSNRFHLVKSNARGVMYECPTATHGQLKRYADYGFFTTMAASIAAATATTPVILADQVICDIEYAIAQQHTGLLSFSVTMRRAATDGVTETVTLLRQTHVDNSP